MEMDPDLLDVEKKQGEGLQPTWGSAQRHGGTRLWHLHQPQSQKRFCPAALPTEQRGAAPCQRPPPCWDISQASSSSWKLLGLLGCGIRNASSPPPPEIDHLLAGGHRPAHPAAPSLGVARVFQALLCNQENFQLQECGLTSLSCQESTGEVRAAWAVGEAPQLARQQAAEVATALDETPLFLLVLLKLTSFGCITAEQTPMPWQPCERYLPIPAGSLFNPLPALPGPPPPSLPGPLAQAISLESRVTAAAPPPLPVAV